MKIRGENAIAGEKSATGDTTFHSRNPATGERSAAACTDATRGELEDAMTAAVDAFEIAREYPPTRHASFLDTVAESIVALGSHLIEVADWETALGTTRLAGELSRTTNQLRAFAAYIRDGAHLDAIIDIGDEDRRPNPKPDVRRMNVPVGPVAVFEASNFPLAFGCCGGDSASAWAAGCPVIVKSHPTHPLTSALFAEAVIEAVNECSYPAGWFSLLHGASNEVGERLVTHPSMAAVAFTGSHRAGRALFDLAAQRERPIPVYAEMGSLNPVFVMPDRILRDPDGLAGTLARSVTLGAGQFCTKPGLIVVTDVASTDAFLDALSEDLAAIEPAVMLNDRIVAALEKQLQQTVSLDGVTRLRGAVRAETHPRMFEPTLLLTDVDTFIATDALHEEHFGPVTVIVSCDSVAEQYELARALPGQLTVTIFTDDAKHAAVRQLFEIATHHAGRVILNDVPTGVEVCPAMQHGGPYPATSAPWSTSVGMTATCRFMRPVAFQNTPAILLPPALRDENPHALLRMVDGQYTCKPL